jgi:mycothiol synthase
MLRPSLAALPEPRLPLGYGLRHFRESDAPHWSAVYADAFGRAHAPELFERIMRADAAFRAERVWFVTFDDIPVATASAYARPAFMPEAGMIHYVATRPAHAGKRLGFAATIAALRHMVTEGWRAAWLSTDDFRLAAIRVYLDLGFQPLLTDDSHRERWPEVFAGLAAPSLAASWGQVLAGPLYSPPAP